MSKQHSEYQPQTRNQPEQEYPQTNHNEIDLLELLRLLWRHKFLILSFTIVSAIGSVIYALSLPDIYRTEVLLSPVEENSNSNAGNLLGQLGGLANIAGLNINGGVGTTRKVRALATLQSRAFIKQFFEDHNILVEFMAVKPGEQSGTVVIDPEVYDVTAQRWINNEEGQLNSTPSEWDVYQAFSSILNIDEDTATGLVTVTLDWYDPVKIKNWLEWLIFDLNGHMRAQDTAQARRAIDYLEDQAQRTQLVEMRNIFYNLIEQQTQTIMLADAREGYVFEVIDPPIVPEQKEAPRRAIICLVITILGFILAIVLIVVTKAVKNAQGNF